MSNVTKVYLFLYNSFQWYGWLAILTDRVFNYDHPDLDPISTMFLYFFQSLAVMEIIHAVFGIVRANVVTTFVQVISRVQLILVHYNFEDARLSEGMIPMVLAWGLVEVVRYLYLALNMFGIAPRFLTWLRYTLFYVLYPLGVYGEMRVLYDALPSIYDSEWLSISLPNSWNFSFSFATYIWLLIYVIYIPGLYIQYTHMMAQRKRALSVGK
jgi:very-long-chain (3R)-3-hydroxyacyl-CoA dehydratase